VKSAEAMDYMLTLQGSGIRPGLERIACLLAYMGNPQDDLKFIHIAGTNGKGSTLAFISEILKEAGYRVGRYISPTISDYKERFQVNSKKISEAMLVKGVEILKSTIEKMAAAGEDTPSAFEAETALAFWYFKEKKCDYVTLEVGMGGLLDATNIIPAPLVCVLASISYDHMGYLGNSLGEIAAQKAGIIKKGSLVVSQYQHSEAAHVIEAKAAECGCALSVVNEDAIKSEKAAGFKDGGLNKGRIKQVFSYKGYKRLELSLLGRYQQKNAALAIEAIEALRQKGVKITDEALRNGLKNTEWPVRFQVVADRPCIILDGAHNEEAAVRLAESIDFYFTNSRIIYIMGMLKDKEYEKVAEITAAKAECIFTVTPQNNPRALSALTLAETVSKYNPKVTTADSPEEALEMASLMAGRDGVIIVFGSLSYLGKMMELIQDGSGQDKRRSKITP